VINWFAGGHPVKANGIGSRQRRVSGNQYDQFGIDYTYQNGMHLNLMCYQISDCSKNVSEFVQGTEGASNCVNRITDLSGETVWEYQYQEELKPWEITYALPALKQEHVDLVTCIRQGIPRGEAEDNAVSTLTAIMGRIAAYTGQEVTWEEMMTSDLRLGPSVYAMGPSDLIHAPIPVPGTEQTKGIR
jgi:hypothetical protein